MALQDLTPVVPVPKSDNNPESFGGYWKFVCECTSDEEEHYIL